MCNAMTALERYTETTFNPSQEYNSVSDQASTEDKQERLVADRGVGAVALACVMFAF